MLTTLLLPDHHHHHHTGRVSIHRCKTDRADELRARHGGGTLLFPPYTAESCAALALAPTNVRIEGETFRRSAADVCVAGLGWFSVRECCGFFRTGGVGVVESPCHVSVPGPLLFELGRWRSVGVSA